MPEQSTLALRLAERLQATGLSARAASLKAGLGQDAVRIILSGRSQQPGAKRLRALAEALNCDVAYLLGEADEPGVSLRTYSLAAAKVGLNVHYLDNGAWRAASAESVTMLRQAANNLDLDDVILFFKAVGKGEWCEVLGGEFTTSFFDRGAGLIVSDPPSTWPVPGQLLIIRQSRSGLVQRGVWRVESADESTFIELSNGALRPEESLKLVISPAEAGYEAHETQPSGETASGFANIEGSVREAIVRHRVINYAPP